METLHCPGNFSTVWVSLALPGTFLPSLVVFSWSVNISNTQEICRTVPQNNFYQTTLLRLQLHNLQQFL